MTCQHLNLSPVSSKPCEGKWRISVLPSLAPRRVRSEQKTASRFLSELLPRALRPRPTQELRHGLAMLWKSLSIAWLPVPPQMQTWASWRD